jgi:hypothetical protein
MYLLFIFNLYWFQPMPGSFSDVQSCKEAGNQIVSAMSKNTKAKYMCLSVVDHPENSAKEPAK